MNNEEHIALLQETVAEQQKVVKILIDVCDSLTVSLNGVAHCVDKWETTLASVLPPAPVRSDVATPEVVKFSKDGKPHITNEVDTDAVYREVLDAINKCYNDEV